MNCARCHEPNPAGARNRSSCGSDLSLSHLADAPAGGFSSWDIGRAGSTVADMPNISQAGGTLLEESMGAPAASVGGAGRTLMEGWGQSASRQIEGRLELLEKLGEGGMGVVWKARDTRLNRLVALKRPKGPILATTQGRARFLREARACAGLAHPNIITVHSVGEDREGPFIEMEFVEGLSLREEVKRGGGRLEEKRAREIALALCDALALAHGRGIVHRDVKPANILLTARGLPKLGDFGLAAAGEDGDRSGKTATGAMLGTLYYAAPEQIRDAKSADARSDVYSLAGTVYFMLTGEDPRRVRQERLPAGLRPVLEKALEDDPAERYPTMKAFGQALAGAGPAAIHDDVSCPKCRKDNPVSARHCTHCGTSLKDLFTPCPNCQVENRIDQKFCQGCGANLAAHAEAERIRAEIERAKAAQDYEEIARLARRGLELRPDEEKFKTALNEAQEYLDTLRGLRKQLEDTGEGATEKQIEILEAILRLTPGDGTMIERLADAQLQLKRLETKRQHEDRLRQADGIEAQLELLPAERLDERIGLLERLVQLQPGAVDAWARLRAAQGQRRDQEIKALQDLARTQYGKHYYKEALATVERARQLAPESEALRLAAERLRVAKAKFDQWQEKFQTKIEDLMTCGDYEKAIEKIGKSPLAEDPQWEQKCLELKQMIIQKQQEAKRQRAADIFQAFQDELDEKIGKIGYKQAFYLLLAVGARITAAWVSYLLVPWICTLLK